MTERMVGYFGTAMLTAGMVEIGIKAPIGMLIVGLLLIVFSGLMEL